MSITRDDYYEKYPERSPQGSRESSCVKFLRWLLMAMNALLTAAAISGLVVAAVDRSRVESALKDMCPRCGGLFTAYIAVFSVLLGFSILGFIALCTRSKCLRVLYFVYLFLVFSVAMAISVTYALVVDDRVDLENAWNSAAEGNRLCDLELHFQCSGWKSLCRTTNWTSDDAFADKGKCPTCTKADQEIINRFGTTCETAILKTVKEYSKKVLPIGFSVVGVAFIAMIVTCLAHREQKREERYGGRYYRV